MTIRYLVPIEWDGTDRKYGFFERKSADVTMEAGSKSEARRLVRETCIIQGKRNFHVGAARLRKNQTAFP